MQQPELGRKIAELRKAKGLTQEELVEKCHLNVRTLQRIEAGEVMPRSYTLKVIFEALEFRHYFSSEENRLEQMIREFADIVNLKKNTMKKVSILSSTLLIVVLGTFMLDFVVDKKGEKAVRNHIMQQNKNSVKWFNAGQIDKLMKDYGPEACFYRNGHPSYCGKEEISRCVQNAVDTKAFKMISNDLISLKVESDLAIEKSLTTSELQSGQIIKTVNIQHWQLVDGKWLIINDIDVMVSE